MDSLLIGMRIDRKNLKGLTRVVKKKMGYRLIGMRMDRKSLKQLTKMGKKMDY